MKDKYVLYNDNEEKIKNLLLYRKITEVKEGLLILDNGTSLEISGNQGCGGCYSGWYSLTELNKCDNVITNVEFDCIENETENGDTAYRIFVYAEDKKIKIAQIDGTDGNGYYGTGYSITVKVKEKEQELSFQKEPPKIKPRNSSRIMQYGKLIKDLDDMER